MSRPGAGPELGQSDQHHTDADLLRRLNACQRHFHNNLQAHDDGVLIVAHDGRVVLVNPAAEALLNRPAAGLTGAPPPVRLSSGLGEHLYLPPSAPGRPPRLAQLRVLPTASKVQPAHLATLRPLTSPNSVSRQTGRDEFLALLAHVLRNPLASIRNALHPVKNSADPALLSEMRDTITRQFENLAHLLDDLLDIIGKITLRPQPTDLSELARSAVAAIGHSAESKGHNQGAQFTIRLPANQRADQPSDTPPPDPATSAELIPPTTSSSPLRVLIVDDNVDSARSISLLVSLWGHHANTAHDGPEALELAASFHPTVALLDIGLPRMDGYELAFRLRQQAGTRPILLIAMTGYGQEEDRARSLATGFDHHLVKPVDLEALEQILTEQASKQA